MNKEPLKALDYEITDIVRACNELTFAPVIGVKIQFTLDLESLEDIKHVRNTLHDLYAKIEEFIKASDEEL